MIAPRRARAVFALCALVALAGAARPAAQGAPTANVANAAPTQIECWSRSSAGAVHVGETFSLALTCAVAETDALKVILDQSGLDPAALRLAPFEILSGTTATDLRSGDRRFFQYKYKLRLIADDAFGRDVKVPEITVASAAESRRDGHLDRRARSPVRAAGSTHPHPFARPH